MNNPSTLIFLGLAVVWAVVLLPEGIKRLSKLRSSDSIRSFSHQLSVLDRSGPGTRRAASRSSSVRFGDSSRVNARPRPRSNVIDLREHRSQRQSDSSATGARPVQVPLAVKRRRQEVIASLAAVAILTLLCGIAFAPVFLAFHVAADVLLVAYLALVSQADKAAQTNNALQRGNARHGYSRSSVTRVEAPDLQAMPLAAGSRSRRSSI